MFAVDWLKVVQIVAALVLFGCFAWAWQSYKDGLREEGAMQLGFELQTKAAAARLRDSEAKAAISRTLAAKLGAAQANDAAARAIIDKIARGEIQIGEGPNAKSVSIGDCRLSDEQYRKLCTVVPCAQGGM